MIQDLTTVMVQLGGSNRAIIASAYLVDDGNHITAIRSERINDVLKRKEHAVDNTYVVRRYKSLLEFLLPCKFQILNMGTKPTRAKWEVLTITFSTLSLSSLVKN